VENTRRDGGTVRRTGGHPLRKRAERGQKCRGSVLSTGGTGRLRDTIDDETPRSGVGTVPEPSGGSPQGTVEGHFCPGVRAGPKLLAPALAGAARVVRLWWGAVPRPASGD